MFEASVPSPPRRLFYLSSSQVQLHVAVLQVVVGCRPLATWRRTSVVDSPVRRLPSAAAAKSLAPALVRPSYPVARRHHHLRSPSRLPPFPHAQQPVHVAVAGKSHAYLPASQALSETPPFPSL